MQWLSNTAGLLDRIIRPVGGLLQGIGLSLLLLMMLLTVSDVILRYLFNRPIVGAFELTEFMMVIFVVFAFVTCAIQKGHVAIDLIMSKMPSKIQSIFGCITTVLSILILSLITWQGFLYMMIQLDTNVLSPSLLIPRYPFVGFVVLGFGFLVIVYISNLLDFLCELFKWRK
ncbi:MAG: TRAP transporter small permease [Deltaproteobacteria bacterium]|nr:TRAP transporter small permease [Deltaproteobacteria bacterium]